MSRTSGCYEEPVTQAEMLDVVRRLRSEGYSPKDIARAIRVPVATVAPLVRKVAEESSVDSSLVGCWVSPGWSEELDVKGHSSWPREGRADGCVGLVSVVVARVYRTTRISACSYLVDTHCLGVKETIGPRIMNNGELSSFKRAVFDFCGTAPLVAPIELAQHLVLGAVEYARALGFEPASDFAECAGHLGAWSGTSSIRFGRHGRPMYIAGPYDDSDRVIETLERSVGKGNFDYIVDMSAPLPDGPRPFGAGRQRRCRARDLSAARQPASPRQRVGPRDTI